MYSDDMSALGRMARQKGIPFSGMFELTERCNLRCKFCYVCDRDHRAEIRPEKTADEWLSVIRQAADMGMLKCSFTGGDPFMREDFEEIYCKAYDMGLRLNIFTNGVPIGKKQRAWLKKRIPDLISISLYGASEETYRTVCGSRDSFHRTMAALDGLRDDGFAFELKVLAMRPLMGEYEALGNIAAAYRCPGEFDPYIGPGRDDPQRLVRDWRLPPEQIMDLFRSFRKPLPPLAPPPARTGQTGGFACGAGKSGFTITYDGRMLGCPSLTCFASSPFRDGFAGAWQELKDFIKNAESCPECSACSEQDRCFICPARRLSETGSILTCGPYLREMVHCLADEALEASG